uniref:Nucleobase-ascorbate transporter 12 n=1 Tax=Ananas comosus var. bracteatus TaxID=296719 RepID=A0A6V7NGW0_ANACO|nr:unnamed protein product [Ananas comosus var. bracteatus]
MASNDQPQRRARPGRGRLLQLHRVRLRRCRGPSGPDSRVGYPRSPMRAIPARLLFPRPRSRTPPRIWSPAVPPPPPPPPLPSLPLRPSLLPPLAPAPPMGNRRAAPSRLRRIRRPGGGEMQPTEVAVAVTADDEVFTERQAHIKYELRDTPGLIPIMIYGLQHYLSMLGSLILIPLVIVPAMGGTGEDTAAVVSTVLFVSGVTTLLHTSFGTRLPLVQGPSFVYLAPVLALINSPEFQVLMGMYNFKHIMKEIQGALIISSAFQAIVGYTGFMSLLLRCASLGIA